MEGFNHTTGGRAGGVVLVDPDTDTSWDASNPLPVTDAGNAVTQEALGAKNDAAATSDTGTFSVIAFIKRAMQNWTTLLARLPTIGQKSAAASVSVVLSTDGPFATSVGAPADAAASSDTGSFSILSFIKRSLQNWTTLLAAVVSGVSVKSAAGTSVAAVVPQSASVAHIDVDLVNARIGRLGMPASIGGATVMTFATSQDGVTYNNLYDEFGTEYSITVGTSRAIVPNLSMFAAARYVRLRFGTAASPTFDNTQTRTINIATLA